ncbi:uncharacterized protein NPIL_374821 [Nephila pilipes]|uniref:Uncharacterized protein n=1 Tax=Nephila pilipes TaxID=299642 RepID=A0A8X6N3V1_NEPPI|nr:uncharacterized protein NPIL_374821 [Nephila pilipes]
MDSSKRSEVKLVPIVVRYFGLQDGIQVHLQVLKLQNFDEMSGKKSSKVSHYFCSMSKKYKLEEKLACQTTDTTNNNYDDVKIKGNENAFRKAQNDLDRHNLRIGCSTHIVHNQ